MTKRQLLLACVAAGALLLAGCSEQERREARAAQERIAAEAAYQQRLAAEYVAKVTAETQRLADELSAETKRQLHRNLTALARLAAVLAAVSGVIAFVVFCIRRLGERHLEERTKRHAMNLMAIEADTRLRPEQRENLYRAAVESANRGGTPLIGYAGNGGGAR
ncbi:hypothetical protein [Oceanibaculum indicum]|uniref:Lipoprotein n=1 Tax=Oceanibaculum indicum P24 TaxID=1207063 RepID=K2JTG8_9PROT|nr:hypothetical protein [Oceanibaculum indicum]EKE68465.1 hypothetical protein P24_17583 [Oceanibaculum indicum P24]